MQIPDGADQDRQIPAGHSFIIGNEIAERFSYYGMNSILVVFMTQNLMDRGGTAAPMTDTEAEGWCHTFAAGGLFPADPRRAAGRRHARQVSHHPVAVRRVLPRQLHAGGGRHAAGPRHRVWRLIALGAGGIKPCV